MAKKRLNIKDNQGNPVAYDIGASNVTIDGENKTLDTKLSEIDNALGQATTGGYIKPAGGIPSTDLAGDIPASKLSGDIPASKLAGDIPKSKLSESVQSSLGKADTALQQETDPTVPAWAKAANPPAQVRSNWNQTIVTEPDFIRNKPALAAVATSGDYNDLRNKPTIPEGSSVQFDTQMSSTSENGVQNKVIKAYVDNLINGLIDGAPAALDTLKELATALGNNQDAVTALTSLISSKANASDVVKSISVNGQTPQTPTEGNVNIQVEGGGLTKEDISVETQGNGTVDINVGSGANKDTYTINLNHTHPNMAKLIVCEESDLPSTLDNDTIYAITDSGETEIEKLIIKGMEFAGGGGTPSTEPKIVSPIGTQIDFNGASTKTVTVRALNLSEALTIAVTGVTANLQTISASDAANGVQLTLTQGQDFESGTLRIYSSEVDKSWNVIDSQMPQSLAAVKFTKQQYLNTDICVGPNTRLEIDMKFDGADTTPNSTTTGYTVASSPYDQTYNPQKVFIVNSGVVNQSALIIFSDTSAQHGIVDNIGSITTRSTLVVDMVNSIVSFGGATSSIPAKTTTMPSGLKFAANPSGEKIFGRFDIILYSLKHYENNVLTHNYVPRIKNAVAGLYDTVNDVFISSETETELVAIS